MKNMEEQSMFSGSTNMEHDTHSKIRLGKQDQKYQLHHKIL